MLGLGDRHIRLPRDLKNQMPQGLLPRHNQLYSIKDGRHHPTSLAPHQTTTLSKTEISIFVGSSIVDIDVEDA
jgi:hypothetical protein